LNGVIHKEYDFDFVTSSDLDLGLSLTDSDWRCFRGCAISSCL